MAGKYPDELREAIWAALCARRRPVDILADIHAGTLDGYPHETPIPERTFFDIRSALIRQRGKPRTRIIPGKEEETLDAIERQGLELMMAEIDRLKDAQDSRDGLNKDDRSALTLLVKTASDIKHRNRARRSPDPAERTRELGRAAPKRSLVQQLTDSARSKYGSPETHKENGIGSDSSGTASDAQAEQPADDDETENEQTGEQTGERADEGGDPTYLDARAPSEGQLERPDTAQDTDPPDPA